MSNVILLEAIEKIDVNISDLALTIEGMTLQQKGFGDGSEGAITAGKVFHVLDEGSPAIIQAKRVHIPAGQTLTTDKPCAGLYIYSWGDVVIDGEINMTDKGRKSNSASNKILLSGIEYLLATCGNGGQANSGGGGNITTFDGEVLVRGGGPASCTDTGNHTAGGLQKSANGGTSANATFDNKNNMVSQSPGGAGGAANVNPFGAGAIVIIAHGSIKINGRIVSKGRDGTNATSGSGGSKGNLVGSSGRGGDSGLSAGGGGAVTLIGSNISVIGTIDLNGGLRANSGTEGEMVAGYFCYFQGGSGGAGTSAGIPGQTKQYLI